MSCPVRRANTRGLLRIWLWPSSPVLADESLPKALTCALEAKAMEPTNPNNPQRIFGELSLTLRHKCGHLWRLQRPYQHWYASDVKMRKGMMVHSGAG